MDGQSVGSPSGLFSLKWKGYGGHLTKGIYSLLEDEDLADVTLACDGNYIRAHRLLLSLCSPYFKKLFQVHCPGKSNTIVILNHVRFTDLQNVLHFVYTGQVNVNQADLSSFLQTGELLQIEGLASCSENADDVPASSSASSSKDQGGTPNSSSRSVGIGGERTKHGLPPSPQPSTLSSSSSSRFPEKRFRPAGGSCSERIGNSPMRSTTSRSSSGDKMEQSLIHIRPESELVEEIDPLEDSNISSYSDHKPSHEEVESCEAEVNFDVLKTEGIEVIDVDDKDDPHIVSNEEVVLANMLEDEGDLSQQQVFYGSQTQSAEDPVFDPAQLRRVGGHGVECRNSDGFVKNEVNDPKPAYSVLRDRVKLELAENESDVAVEESSSSSTRFHPHQQRRQQSLPLSTPIPYHVKDAERKFSGGISVTPISHAGNRLQQQYHPTVARVPNQSVACSYPGANVPKYGLRDHGLSHTRNETQLPEARAVCPHCSKSFKNKNSLKVHKSIYHRNRPFRPPNFRGSTYGNRYTYHVAPSSQSYDNSSSF